MSRSNSPSGSQSSSSSTSRSISRAEDNTTNMPAPPMGHSQNIEAAVAAAVAAVAGTVPPVAGAAVARGEPAPREVRKDAIHVGALPADAKQDAVQAWFAKFGPVKECVVSARTFRNADPVSIATVVFETEAAASAAIATEDKTFEGCNIVIEAKMGPAPRRAPRSPRAARSPRAPRGGGDRDAPRGDKKRSRGGRGSREKRDRAVREGDSSRGAGKVAPPRERAPMDGSCFNCGGRGHRAAECPSARMERGGGGGRDRGGRGGDRRPDDRRDDRRGGDRGGRGYEGRGGRGGSPSRRDRSPPRRFDRSPPRRDRSPPPPRRERSPRRDRSPRRFDRSPPRRERSGDRFDRRPRTEAPPRR